MSSVLPRVVCIEDEPEMIDLVKLILSRKGFEVIGATSGQTGLHLIEQLQPELVLLDLIMPDMDGWEVYQKMKSNSTTAHIPVIIVTAKAQSLDRMLGLRIAKVDGYVTKPFGPSELLASVQQVIGKKV
ncbi:MAG: response regulator [Anaerolineae bacterium]|nr:response regulator [Anaerolineae bacterium]